ncbi:hypothetical protein EBU71_05460 [bacterium]|nr:hypothetical protein [Candidatus Elulimicrobium humile]
MIQFYKTIDTFWQEDLKNHSYARTVPFVARNFDHLDRNYYNRDHLLQSFNEELSCADKFEKVLNVKKSSVSWTCILPNTILPTHRDTFYTLRQQHHVEIDQCFRYLIFLEDWVFGHIAVFENKIITDWKAGDVWIFDSEELHYAVNASNRPFHSCQVSTFK